VLAAVAEHRHPWARASAAEDAGVLLEQDGDSTTARSQLHEALSTYEAMGAVADAARVRIRLRDLAVRRRAQRPVTGWASLTDTERKVALVVAEGVTNAEAAERMYLSRHTVDFHLRHIFQKLTIRSRVELVRATLDQTGRPS
jgi:DNA-binding CsgD family transcriptional regulator